MIRTTAKIIKVCFYAAIILAGVVFAISNRGKVDLTFYPIPFAISMPLFLFTIMSFSIGVIWGWLIGGFKAGRFRRAHKKASKRVEALENELGAMRSEQIVSPTAALPQK